MGFARCVTRQAHPPERKTRHQKRRKTRKANNHQVIVNKKKIEAKKKHRRRRRRRRRRIRQVNMLEMKVRRTTAMTKRSKSLKKAKPLTDRKRKRQITTNQRKVNRRNLLMSGQERTKIEIAINAQMTKNRKMVKKALSLANGIARKGARTVLVRVRNLIPRVTKP